MKNNLLRMLARSKEWQLKYHTFKELGIKIFDNTNELSYIQSRFLQWLSIYDSLYTDLYLKEENIDETVIKIDRLCDAYLYWKGHKKDNNKQTVNNLDSGIPSVTFVPGSKKE